MKSEYDDQNVDTEEMAEIEYLRQCISERLEDVTNVRKLRMIYEFVDGRL